MTRSILFALALLVPAGATLLAVALGAALIACALLLWRLRRAAQALRHSERRHRALVEDNGVGIWQVTPNGHTVFLNGTMRQMLEIESAEDIGDRTLDCFFTPESMATIRSTRPLREQGMSSSYEVELVGRQGGHRNLLISGAPIFGENGELASLIGTCLDISEHKAAERALRESDTRLRMLTHHDPLTGLINRRRFEQELRLQLSRARRYQVHGALLWCDIDRFKDLNDTLGHRAGDELLVRVAASLRHQVGDTHILARLGGDEFAVLMPHAGPEEAQQLAARLLEGVRGNPVVLGGRPIRPTASIGIVLFPQHGTGSEELLSHADLAMYQAKADGRNRCLLYSGERGWQAKISSDLGQAERVREALENDDFLVYLQPIRAIRPRLETERRETPRFELLLRLRTHDGTVLLPDAFLGIAERFGVLRQIDRWVVGRAMALIGQERRAGRRLHLDVNLSGGAFTDPELLPWIQAELAAAGIEPGCLALEITETAAVTDLDQARTFIETLKTLGCQFAIDDFGVGFSSFYYLKHLPLDLLKIDGSFIENLTRDPVNQNLVRAIVAMANGLGVRTVAEYVGDDETLDWLRRHGVDYAQGYGIGRPRPAEDVLAELAAPAAGGRPAGAACEPPPLADGLPEANGAAGAAGIAAAAEVAGAVKGAGAAAGKLP
jgi:diguanylate cyclase (GGDEF)-like protein/PAS domain S-box-containing protein